MSISESFKKLGVTELHHFTDDENIQRMIDVGEIIYSRFELDTKGLERTYMTDSDSRNSDDRQNYNHYVFLVFLITHPMIYKKQMNGHNLTPIPVDICVLDIPGVLITDRIATDGNVTLYTPEEALIHLDITSIGKNERLEKDIWNVVKKYEILIPKLIDLNKYLGSI